MFFKTISGSVYELDTKEKRVRRLAGVKEPTSRQGHDGDWKVYELLHVLGNSDGKPFFLFDWTGLGNGTATSQIAEIVDDHENIFGALTETLLNNAKN